jgi:hypothetical protein
MNTVTRGSPDWFMDAMHGSFHTPPLGL